MTDVSECLGRPSRAAALLFSAIFFSAIPALAQTGGLPDYGHQWSVVTGINAPTQTVPTAGFPQGRTINTVNYDYRIMTREVTNAEWLDFVQAFAPHLNTTGVSDIDTQFTGGSLERVGYANGVPQYAILSGRANRPTLPGWRFTARFANWLHNGKPTAASSPGGVVPISAFSSGAYDTSTFGATTVPPGVTVLTDQSARSEGARFWIPNMHEWVKAMYWDPDRNGLGQAGYWAYPITSDTAPIPGDPALGGQTNTGTFPQGHARPLDVGSYASVMSPWGLLDGSGGATEWLEDLNNATFPQQRLIAGSRFTSTLPPEVADELGRFATQSPFFSGVGIRLASMVVPSPGVVLTLGSLFLGWGGRRSRYVQNESVVDSRR